MFRYRRADRAAGGAVLPATTPSHAACDAVCTAEQIVRHAWESVLTDRAERMESAVQSARTNCHAAYQRMTEAHRGDDIDEISTARASLREAIVMARKSSTAAKRIRQTLLAELNLLTRTAEEHTRAALVGQAARIVPEATVQPDRPAGTAPSEPRFAVAVAPRPLRGLVRFIRSLLRIRAAATPTADAQEIRPGSR